MDIDARTAGQITVTILIGLALYRWILKPLAKKWWEKVLEADENIRDEMWMGS